jgi:hypothetical protein
MNTCDFKKFLKSIGIQIDNKEIKRWHVKFDLESIDDIPAAELPQPPNEVKCKNADDIRQIAQEIYSCKVKSAIEQFQDQNSSQMKIEPNAKQTQTINKLTASYDAKRLKNFNTLLEKVRFTDKTNRSIQSIHIISNFEGSRKRTPKGP